MELIDRTLNVIMLLSEELNGMSVSEISESLNLPMSTTHRILKSLINNRFVIQSDDTKKYSIGYKALTIGEDINQDDKLIEIAKPIMKDLADNINQTVTLCKLANENIICIYYIESEDTSMFLVRTGYAMPPHATSAGKAILAYSSTEEIEDIFLKHHKNQITKNTITSLNAFVNKLNEVKTNGYAMSDEELQLGVYGIAAPIFNSGKIVASVSFTSLKVDNGLTETNIKYLKECANSITDKIS